MQQNLLDSHDSNRIGSHVVNKDLYEFRNWADYFLVSKAENPQYNTRKPNRSELQIQKLLVIFQMTYLGAPMIYYGDEAGMWGANDPDCRKPMLWNDMEYDNEKYLHDQTLKPQFDKVEFNKGLYGHYKKLIKIRNSLSALRTGDFKTLLKDDKRDIYIFSRRENNRIVIVALNNSVKSAEIILENKNGDKFNDALNGEDFKSRYNKLKFTIPAKWGRILVKQNDY